MGVFKLIKESCVSTKMQAHNQCKDVGHESYSIVTTVTCLDDRLDESGFIIDNTILHKCAEWALNNFMGSCEQLAVKVLDEVHVACRAHGVSLLAIDISVKPTNGTTTVQYSKTYTLTK